jgi:hypothetical protein
MGASNSFMGRHSIHIRLDNILGIKMQSPGITAEHPVGKDSYCQYQANTNVWRQGQ